MFALKNLLRRKIRTVLSILGVGVGVASIVAFASIGDSFKATINEYARESGAHLVAFDERVADPIASRLTKDDFEGLLKVDNVEDVCGSAAAPSFHAKFKTGILVLGRDPGTRLMKVYQNQHFKGRLLEKRDEVLLSELRARELGAKIGDSITLFGKQFTIVGIFRTNVTWETGAAVAHGDIVREALRIPEGAAMIGFIYLKNPDKLEETAEAIRQKMPHLRIEKTEGLAANIDQLEYVDAFVWIISLAALIVGAIGVLNTLLMSVSERVREIGTLRAFGWSRGQVMHFIMSEGLVISILGGIAGNVMGFVGAKLLILLLPQGFIDAQFNIPLLIKGLVVAVIVGFLGAVYPAYRASKLPPAEALRYE